MIVMIIMAVMMIMMLMMSIIMIGGPIRGVKLHIGDEAGAAAFIGYRGGGGVGVGDGDGVDAGAHGS